MNWLDIILVIVIVALLIAGIVLFVLCAKDDEIPFGLGVFAFFVGVAAVVFFCSFVTLDRKSGNTVGEIISVEKNFFGTTAMYVKVNEATQENYCIESDNIADLANEYVGKKVKITYGKRIGIYSTGACSEAPVDSITLLED